MRKMLLIMLVLLVAGSASARELAPLKTDLAPVVTTNGAEAACVAGNDNAAGILGYYDTWFAGFENYTVPINAGDGNCSCTEGVTITTVHMMLALDDLANLDVAAAILDANGDGTGCLTPGAEIAVSPAMNITGLTGGAAYYDIAIPIEGPCATVGDAQFISVYFLNDNDGQFFGLPITDPPNGCFGYNDWGSGYVDLVTDYGFAGDLMIWAEMECCATPVPTENTSFGDVKSLFR